MGKDVAVILKNDLKMELRVVNALRKAIAVCKQNGDYVSRELLENLLKDPEEDHAYWLEEQLGSIEKVGLQNYLQSQVS